MSAAYFHHLFSPPARALQARAGSRRSYARMEAGGEEPDSLTERELDFIAARDSFYMASVTPDGWPYVQHRGGPQGFLKGLGPDLLGFADYSGNRQYISMGNLAGDDRISLICMDYPARRRLKILGRARIVDREADPTLVDGFDVGGGPPAERAILIDVVGFDWNCPKYITPRFTLAELEPELRALREDNGRLRAELARLQGQGGME